MNKTLIDHEKKQVIKDFEGLMRRTKHNHCICCHRIRIKQQLNSQGVCKPCQKHGDKQYYLKNDGLPVWYFNGDKEKQPQFHVPDELKNLTIAEKMLIQRVSPFVPLHHIKGGTMGLKGHVCAFEQDITGMTNVLPKPYSDIDIIRVEQLVRSEVGSDVFHRKPFKVSRSKVVTALYWLKTHNPEYSDIEIDETNLEWIGESDIGYIDVKTVIMESEMDNPLNEDNGPIPSRVPNVNITTATGFVDNGGHTFLSEPDEHINDTLQDSVATSPEKKKINMTWPKISETAVNEYSDTKVFCRAFPWLFPGGIGDPIEYPQTSGDWGSQMLFYEDARFIVDPIFTFFALNYVVRHRNSSSGRFFIEKFQQDAPETLEELKQQIEEGDTRFINSLSYYSKRVKGCNSYWMQKRAELYTWINHHVEVGNGVPMFFITLSCAEYCWKDIDEIIRNQMELSGMDTSNCSVGSPGFPQLVNDFSVVVQEYFQERVKTWLETVGKTIFGIEHYWVRYEFAPGRGQIHAHLLAITRNQDVYSISHAASRLETTNNTKAEILAQWAQKTIGLTASMDTTTSAPDSEVAQPTTVRFMDLTDTDEAHTLDDELLKNAVQLHECSGFCMRTTKKEK